MINSPFFLSEAVVRALGWTLLHSLWQGAALAAVLWLVLPRLQSARQRYWVSYAALTSILIAAVVSFVWIYNTQKPVAAQTQEWALTISNALPPAALEVLPAADHSFWSVLTEKLEAYQPLIVTVWLLGFLFFLIQLAGGLHFMYRLRKYQNQTVAEVWQKKIQQLGSKIGISRPVALLESALVQVPLALGFFKPLILLPVGMINQLSAEQVEAILAHELAHIARRDWLFNLFQAIIEAIFYFHPAIWWISATIRSERENCCDDKAVSLTGNRLVYAKTLVQLQDIVRQPATPVLTLSMQGAVGWRRHQPLLLQRIKRILHQPQQSTSFMEKTIAMAILVALISFWTLRANTPPALVESIREIAEKPLVWLGKAPQAMATWQAASDSLPKPKARQRIVRDDDNQKVELELENGQITQLKIDGEEIEVEAYSQYQSLTDDMLRDATPPPAPPTPPDAPRAPLDLWFSDGLALTAPSAPTRISSRVSTETDDAGNTIIRVERNGKPMEIKVKNGEVWVDDKKVEDGETLDIPGGSNQSMFWNDGNRSFQLNGNRLRFHDENGKAIEFPRSAESPQLFEFDKDGNHFIFEGPEGMVFEMPEVEWTKDELMKFEQKSAHKAHREQQLAIEKQMKEFEKEWNKNRKEWSKEQKEQFRALELAQRSMQDAARAEQEAVQRIREKHLRIDENFKKSGNRQRLAVRENRREPVSTALQNELLKEKLITDAENYSLDLSGKSMKVNGKKQSDDIHKKYLDLYRRKTGKELSKKDQIRIEVQN